MLHYYAKDFFAPVIVTSRVTQANELEIHVISDLLQPLDNLSVEALVYKWTSSKSINTTTITNITIVNLA